MRILALDTALGATSVAFYESGADGFTLQESIPMQRGHGEALLPMVERVVRDSGIHFQQIDRFAVTIGPGSFTGLRIGIAAARGLALAHDRPVVGISSLAAFAAPVLFGGAPAPVAAAIDARHGMIFFQCMGIDGRVLAGPGLFPVDEAARRTGDGPMVFVGDAALLLAQARKGMASDMRVSDMVRPAPAPDTLWVARLAAAADPHFAPARPLYLREANVTPQAHGRLVLAGP